MLQRQIYHFLEAERQQWMKPEELRRLQDAKLRAMVRHAYANVPFYRRAWKAAGVRPEDVRGAEDMRKLPIITRRDIKGHEKEFVSAAANKKECIRRGTTGSTGQPLTTLFDDAGVDRLEGLYLRPFIAVGYKPWYNTAYFFFMPAKKRFYEHLGILRKTYIRLDATDGEQFNLLAGARPDMIYGNPATLQSMAKLAKRRHVDDIKPKLIVSQGESLTDDVRKLVESIFGCDMFDHYGTSEFSRIGWECREHLGMHIEADSVFTEFLDDGENVSCGEEGNVTVTGLVNMAMPYIRYDLGDRGMPLRDACPCGRGLPLMKIVGGLRDDFIVLPDGAEVNPRMIRQMLFPHMLERNEIFQLKIVQEKPDVVKVYIVKDREFSSKSIEDVRRTLDTAFRGQVKVEFDIVEQMPNRLRGKLKCIESKVRRRC